MGTSEFNAGGSPRWSNTSQHNLSRIQAVKNSAACIVSNSRKYNHISSILKKWLLVRQQLYYCHAIMAFKCMTRCTPDFFSRYIQRVTITKHTTKNSHHIQRGGTNIPGIPVSLTWSNLAYKQILCITHYHQLSFTLNLFILLVIVYDNFSLLTMCMIVHASYHLMPYSKWIFFLTKTLFTLQWGLLL